jgi:protein-tyrosine-phosphatase
MEIPSLNKILEKGVKNVLFVCTGNICRSPIAEYLLRKELSQLNISGIEIKSAGLLELGSRPADQKMIALCKEHDVDLTSHISRQVTLQMITNADLVFVMETGHHDALIKLKPEDGDKVLLLSIFDFMHNGLNINDPLGTNHQKYSYCFSRIYASIRKLALLIQKTPPKPLNM